MGLQIKGKAQGCVAYVGLFCFFEGYVHTLTYSILAYGYVNKNTSQLQHSTLIKTVANMVNCFQNCLSQYIVALKQAVLFTTLQHLPFAYVSGRSG